MKKYKCPWCEGSGIGEATDESDEPKCGVCDGDGKVLFNPEEERQKHIKIKALREKLRERDLLFETEITKNGKTYRLVEE